MYNNFDRTKTETSKIGTRSLALLMFFVMLFTAICSGSVLSAFAVTRGDEGVDDEITEAVDSEDNAIDLYESAADIFDTEETMLTTKGDIDLAGTGYGSATLYYVVPVGAGTESREVSFTISNNKGSGVMDFTDADIGENVKCYLKVDSDYFGNNVSTTQGATGWIAKNTDNNKDICFTVKVTAQANVTFSVVDIRPNDNPPSVKFTMTDDQPNYYLVGSENIAGTGRAWNITADQGVLYNHLDLSAETGRYEKTYTLTAGSSATTYIYRIRNKGVGDWNGGTNYNYNNLIRPITDDSKLISSTVSDGSSDKNIKFTLRANQSAKVTIAIEPGSNNIYMTVVPTICTVSGDVSPAGAGTATVTDGTNITPGSTVNLAATSSDATKYVFSKWVSNKFLTYDDATAATTTAVASGTTTAVAQFVKKTYNLSKGAETDGTFTLDKSGDVAWGTTVTVTPEAAAGYELSAIKVNGAAIEGNTFEMPTADATVTVEFTPLPNKTISFSAVGEGYVSAGYAYSTTHDEVTQSIETGASVRKEEKLNFCAIPKQGNKFVGWYIDQACETAATFLKTDQTVKDITVTVGDNNITLYAKFIHEVDNAYTRGEGVNVRLLFEKSDFDNKSYKLYSWWGETYPNGAWNDRQSVTGFETVIGVDDTEYYYFDYTTDGINFKLTNGTTESGNVTDKRNGTYLVTYAGGTDTPTCNAFSDHAANETKDLVPIFLNVTGEERLASGTTHVKAYGEVDDKVTVTTGTLADTTNDKIVVTANDADVSATKKFDAVAADTKNPNTVNVEYKAKDKYTVNFSAGEGGSVTATADGNAITSGTKVNEGTSVTLTATPSSLYYFSAWSNGAVDTTATITKTINADTTFVANFAEITYGVVWTNGSDAIPMKKLPNGTWISTSTMNNGYNFSIKKVVGSTTWYSHSGATDVNNGWAMNQSSLDSSVSDKVGARWYTASLSNQQSYKNNIGSAAYVVYDPATDKMWLTTSEEGLYPVIVYLTDGTIRSLNGGDKVCTSAFGTTVLLEDGTTSGVTSANFDGSFNSGSTAMSSTAKGHIKQVVITSAQLAAGVKLHIKTTVNSGAVSDKIAKSSQGGYKYSDYYVKGFDVNGGLTQALVNQEFNDDDERTEKASYADYAKIHGTDNNNLAYNDFVLELKGSADPEIVVTPIYFKRAAHSTDNVRFYADSFAGKVSDVWGGRLAVYPYITDKYNPFGEYPGQLMVNVGGRYMADIPATYVDGTTTNDQGKTVDNVIHVQGLTMNNYIWDDVHHEIDYYNVEQKNQHYQTYDYNEFDIINKIFMEQDLDEDIIFSFKYKDAVLAPNSNLGEAIFYRDYEGYDGTGDNKGKKADGTMEVEDYRNKSFDPSSSIYQWEDLTDFYGNRVDIMGNLVDVEDNEEKAAYNPILVVSNGYDNSAIGHYATAWAYYKPTNWTGDPGKYELFEVMGGQGNTENLFQSESYLINPDFADAILRKYTNQGGSAQILDCEHVPVKISYEYEVYSGHSNLYNKKTQPSGEGEDKAYRSDGRWYYSNSDQLVTAHTIIALMDNTGKITTRDYYQADGIDYTNPVGEGGYDMTDHTGVDTGIQAYFTNDGTENIQNKTFTNTSGYTEANGITDGEYQFTMTTVGDPAGDYEFVGWYLYNGKDYSLASTEVTYADEAKANDVYAAVYRKVPSGTLNITHELDPASTAEANCYAKVEILDSAGNVTDSESYPVTSEPIKVSSKFIKYNSTDKIRITLTSTAVDADYSTFTNFEKMTASGISNLTASDNLGIGATVTVDKSNATKSSTVTFDIKDLFTEEEQTVKSLQFYSLWQEIAHGTLDIHHYLDPNSTGTAKCFVQVDVLDGNNENGAPIATYQQMETGPISIPPDYIKNNQSGYVIKVSLETQMDPFCEFEQYSVKYADDTDIIQPEKAGPHGERVTMRYNADKTIRFAEIKFSVSSLFDRTDGHLLVDEIDYYSLVGKPTFSYVMKYNYAAYNRDFGTQAYTITGTFLPEELTNYMEFKNETLSFKADANNEFARTFINNHAPHEDNFLKTISFNVPSVDDTHYSEHCLTLDIKSIEENTPVSPKFVFPYNVNGDNSPKPSDDGIIHSDQASSEEKGHTVYCFDWYTTNGVRNASSGDDPDFITAPLIYYDDTQSKYQYFRYWKVETKAKWGASAREYTRCYDPEFNLSIFQDCTITPVFDDAFAGTQRPITAEQWNAIDQFDAYAQRKLDSDNGVTISFIENSRNQYNMGDYGTGDKKDTMKASRRGAGDRIYSDFLMSFNNVGDADAYRLMDLESGVKKAGLIIQAVGNLPTRTEGGTDYYTEDESVYARTYGELLDDNTVNDLKNFINGGNLTNTIKAAEFDANTVDNKNRIEYHYSFANRAHKSEDAVDKTLTNAFLSNNHKIYRAIAYIGDVNGDTLENIQLSTKPVYFTIYDIGTIAPLADSN